MACVWRYLFLVLMAGSVTGLVGGVAPRPASACGGFFCAQTPIDQSGEYILFSVTEKATRAYIQIQYQGKAEDFAWVVPVQTPPRKIGVGVQQVFTTVMGSTAPRYRIDWGSTASCASNRSGGPAGAAAPTSPGSGGAGGAGVAVIDKGEVGPYDYVVLAATEAEKLKTWLDGNGFVQPPSAQPALAHYVQQKFAFVAIKLKRDAMVGEIQPLVLDMDTPEACVPLVLTRIAAVPDMPIYVMVLGKGRAAPRNWFEVEPSNRRIDWFTNGANYRQVVMQAIDEAAGRAFVTEFAGDTSRFANALWSPGRYDLSSLREMKDPTVFVQALLGLGLPRDPIIQSLLRKYIPMPAAVRARGVNEANFYNSLSSFRADLAGQPFDPIGFARELDERMVVPLREAQEMIDGQRWLTRLFTTISPDEMTRDPFFDFNTELPPVNNVHVAQMSGACGADGRIANATLRFDNGDSVTFPEGIAPFGVPSNLSYMAGPSASRISLVGTTGQPIRVSRTRVRDYDQKLDTLSATLVRELARTEPQPEDPPVPGYKPPRTTPMPPPTSDGTVPNNRETIRGSAGGCSVATTAEPALGGLLLLTLLSLARLRKTRSGS